MKHEDILRLVFFETTAGCNLECIHCRRLDVSREMIKDDLSTDEAVNLIDQITEISKLILVFSGGEPLIRPDIFNLMKTANNKGLKVALATNGILVTEEIAKKIVDCGVERTSISLDGADSDTHNHFRKIENSFEKAIEGLHNLSKFGMSIQINITVAKHNAHQLKDMFDLATKLNADALHLFMLVPVGCGVEISDAEMLSPQEYEDVLNNFYEFSSQYSLITKATCSPHFFRIKLQRKAQERKEGIIHDNKPQISLHSETRGCLAGSSVLFVSHKGQVFPCGYLPVEVGNIRQTRLKEIWEKSKVFSDLRMPDALKGKCGICEYRKVCMGCRARAFFATGDYMDEEPYCVYVPKK